MSKQEVYRYSCLTILFLLFLTPTIHFSGMIGFRMEEVYIVFLMFLVLFLINNGSFWNVQIPVRVVLLIVFSIIIILSIGAGAFLGLPSSLLDFTKYIWLFKSIVIYLIFYNYVYLSEGGRDHRREYILKNFIKFSLLSSLICFQQYFDLFDLNSFYVPIVAPTQYETLMPGYPIPRVVGMLGNPNVQGFVLALSLICFVYLLLQNRKQVNIYYFPAIFSAMIMTLSRSSLIVFVVGSSVLFFLYKKNKRLVFYKFSLLLIFALLAYVIYWFLKENDVFYDLIFRRFERLEDVSEETSFTSRYSQWQINIEYFMKSPIFGVGPLPRSEGIFGAADNEWLFFLRAYGVVGVSWLLLFFFLPIFASPSKIVKDWNVKVFSVAILFASCLYMIPAAIVTSTTVFPFLLILLSNYDISKYSLAKSPSHCDIM